MQFLQHKLKELLIFLIILAPTVIVYTFLLYFGHASNDIGVFRKATFIIGLVILLLTGFFSGAIEQKKGWIAGLSTALLILSIAFIIHLFKGATFRFEHFLKYFGYLSSATLGGIIGVNFKLNALH